MDHEAFVEKSTVLLFAYLLMFMAVAVLVVGIFARTEGSSTVSPSHISMRSYNTMQQQKTEDACSYYTCASGNRCVLTERGVTCLP